MGKLEKLVDKYWFIILIVLSIPATWALFVNGYYGASDDMHPAWLYELDKTIKLGQIPPRFVPDLSFGFGYPLFNFAFPLPFYIAEVFHLLGFSLVDSIKTVFFLSIPLSAYFMYLFLREFISRTLSLAGAVLYIYAPYRAVDIYIRGTIGEIVSFIFLPLIFLSLFKLKHAFNGRWIGIGGFALASLVLSHNIAAYMFFPFLILFFVLHLIFSSKKLLFLINSILMVFLALLISIYFWLPALVESSLMKYDAVFNFADHFPTIKQLFTPYWGYGSSVPGPYDGMSFFLGTVHILMIVLGISLSISFWKKFNKNIKILLIWVFLSLSAVFFIMNYRSSFLWSNIPLLPYFQFPWRFLILTTFAIPLLIVVFDKFKHKYSISLLIIIITLITGWSYFRPQDFLGRQDVYYLNRYIPTPTASLEYLKIQEEYLRLPKNTDKRPDRNYPLVFIDNGLIKQVSRINDLDVLIRTEATSVATLNYSKYLFPGWVAEIDGQKTETLAGKPFGQITVNVASGSHTVKIIFEETNFKRFLNAISLVSFLVSLGLITNLWPRVFRLFK